MGQGRGRPVWCLPRRLEEEGRCSGQRHHVSGRLGNISGAAESLEGKKRLGEAKTALPGWEVGRTAAGAAGKEAGLGGRPSRRARCSNSCGQPGSSSSRLPGTQ